jgi:hypothetical protein
MFMSSCNDKHRLPRAAVWIKEDCCKSWNAIQVDKYTCRDMTTVSLSVSEHLLKACNVTSVNSNNNKVTRNIILVSLYCPSLDKDGKSIPNPINEKIEDLINEYKSSSLIIGADSNAHHTLWGGKNAKTNKRGENLVDFMLCNDIEFINKNKTPTYSEIKEDKVVESVIDFIMVNSKARELIKDWSIDSSNCSSDHKPINCDIGLKVNSTINYFKKSTNWKKYQEEIKKLRKLNLNVSNASELDLLVEKFTDILKKAYERNCRTRNRTKNLNMQWYTNRLKDDRKRIQNLTKYATKVYKIDRPRAVPIFVKVKKLKKQYKKDCFASSKKGWETFVNGLESISDIARMQKLKEKGNDNKIVTLLKPDGEYTENLPNTLRFLMECKFPGCKSIKKRCRNPADNPETAEPCEISDEEENEIEKLLSSDKLEWAISSLKPFKSPGADGIFPALLQKGKDEIIPVLKELFRASLKLGYIPKLWRKINVTMIPKTNRPRYDVEGSYRPISLASFALKVLEKLLDNNLRNVHLSDGLLSKFQHAYQQGMSTDSALHAVVNEIEKRLQSKNGVKGMCLATFIDIEAAFDRTSFSKIIESAEKKGVSKWKTNWIRKMLISRELKARDDPEEQAFHAVQGIGQGSCISPLLWVIVVDSLLNELKEKGHFAVAYADDIAIVVGGSPGDTIYFERMQDAMNIVENWCTDQGQKVPVHELQRGQKS